MTTGIGGDAAGRGLARVAYVLPTRDRSHALWETLAGLAGLPRHDAEVVVVDNGSVTRAAAPRVLPNGLPVRVIRLETNEGAAARNVGARAVDRGVEWLVMLDDDSCPLDLGHLAALRDAAGDVAAVAAEIVLPTEPRPLGSGSKGSHRDLSTLFRSDPFDPLPDGRGSVRAAVHESGGLPEVPVGCGVAVRRDVFLEVGGYDAAFGYYAEEYDLAARLLRRGHRVALDRRFRVLHRKVSAGRDMDLILHRLVRNNGWVAQRYAPARLRLRELRETLDRYGAIAAKEGAPAGYLAGKRELLGSVRRQPRTPLTPALWDRFTGKAEARRSLHRAWLERGFRSAAVVEPGKGERHVRAALQELGVRVVENPDAADALVIGTLSPGPLLDAWERWRGGGRVVSPWGGLTADGCAAFRRGAGAG